MFIMVCNIKSLRKDLGLTQVEFAVQSGISLPTLQNIEAGKANPSLDILQKILTTLGMELRAQAPTFDIDKAVLLGVPLVINRTVISSRPTKAMLRLEARKWVHYFKNNIFSEREQHAIVSFLCALKDHWPTDFKEIDCPIFAKKIKLFKNNGHVIKLRRISISNLSKYL